MKTEQYSCDFCKRTLPPTELIGINWQGKSDGTGEPSPIHLRMESVLIQDATTHLCRQCAGEIKRLTK